MGVGGFGIARHLPRATFAAQLHNIFINLPQTGRANRFTTGQAAGLRQVYENVVQLRGEGGARQVPGNPKTAYTHVYGAPGVSAVTILER